jgi:hypothetical protein
MANVKLIIFFIYTVDTISASTIGSTHPIVHHQKPQQIRKTSCVHQNEEIQLQLEFTTSDMFIALGLKLNDAMDSPQVISQSRLVNK